MRIEKIHKLFENCSRVSTDSRDIRPGDMFVALKGENFNGNEFAKQALDQGAHYAIVSEDLGDDKRFIKVEDTLETLQDLAREHRREMGLPILAITGSNGKTTTKELITAVLASQYNVLATTGNYNNHIGVPLTLLSIKPDHEIAIVEMGANHVGEIAALCEIAEPDYGIITNCGVAHIEGFGSAENVKKAKGELYEFLNENDGTAFVNSKLDYLLDMSVGVDRKLYSTEKAIPGKPEPFLNFSWNEHQVNTNLIGSYNLDNVMSAIAIGRFFKIADERIVEAIENYQPDNNRSQLTRIGETGIIMDAYNANPTSMHAALANLRQMEGRLAAILGDMKELGDESAASHSAILKNLAEQPLTWQVLVGEEFLKAEDELGTGFPCFATVEDLVNEFPLKEKLREAEMVLVKGSRGVRLERAVEGLG